MRKSAFFAALMAFAALVATADTVLTFSPCGESAQTSNSIPTDVSSPANGDFTWEAWFRPSNLYLGENRMVAQTGWAWNSPGRLMLAVRSHKNNPGALAKKPILDVFFNNGATVRLLGKTVITEGWHHAALVRQGTTLSIYLDGAFEASTNNYTVATPSGVDTAPFLIGPAFYGSLAEVRLWNVARTAVEISASKGRRLSGMEPNLLGYWPLDEGGTSVAPVNKMTGVAATNVTVSVADMTRTVGYNQGAGTGSAVYATDAELPLLPPMHARVSTDFEHARLTFNFDNGCMQGWHNRVWVTNGVGEGAWTDLPPNTYGFDTLQYPIPNNNLIYPASVEDENALFCSSSRWYPWEQNNRGSYLTIGRPHDSRNYLDTGSNTRWVRSPKFRITGPGDLTFCIVWGQNDADEDPSYDVLVDPVARETKGWTGVCLAEVDTGRFVLCQRGLGVLGGTYQNCRFTEAQLAAAGVTPEKRYTLDVITMRAGFGSWIALDDVVIPGVLDDPDVGALNYEFAEDSMQGWHNRVWDVSAESGLGAWVDLLPNVNVMPATVNNGAIYPETTDTEVKSNVLFTCYCMAAYPEDRHRCGSYLIPGDSAKGGWVLNAGSNVKWARSPEFFIDGTNSLSFWMRWGRGGGYLRDWESMVTNSAVGDGWTGVALRDAESGRFVLKAPGVADLPFAKHSFTAADIAKLDLNRAYTLDIITKRAGDSLNLGSWIALDNVSIPGHQINAYMTSFSLGALGAAARISGEMEFTVPQTTDVTRLAPTFTLGDGATCDYVSGTVRDFSTPQVYTVTLPDGTRRGFRVTVNKATGALSVTDGLVYRLRADAGVICDDSGHVLKWKPSIGAAGDLTVAVPTNPPTYVESSTPNGRPSIHFAGPCTDGGTSGQGLIGCGTTGMPVGSSARTVFLRGRYNFAEPPESHGWGGFVYGMTPTANTSGRVFDNGSAFGLVSTSPWFMPAGAIQSLSFLGWGVGYDFPNDTTSVGQTWFTQCVTATPNGDGKVDLRHYLNGVLQNTHLGISYSTGRALVAVACAPDEASYQLMDLCEVLVYDRVLSASEQKQVEAYLVRQWEQWSGLTIIFK